MLGSDPAGIFVVSKYAESRALLAHSSAENIFFIVWKYINLIIDEPVCERAIEAWPAHHSVFSNHRLPQRVKNEKSMQSLWDSKMNLWGITCWFIRKKWSLGQQCGIVRTGLAPSRKDQDRTRTVSLWDALNPLQQCIWCSSAAVPVPGRCKQPPSLPLSPRCWEMPPGGNSAILTLEFRPWGCQHWKTRRSPSGICPSRLQPGSPDWFIFFLTYL